MVHSSRKWTAGAPQKWKPESDISKWDSTRPIVLTEEVVYNVNSCKGVDYQGFEGTFPGENRKRLGSQEECRRCRRFKYPKSCINLRPISIGTSSSDIVLVVIQSETRKYLKCDNLSIFSISRNGSKSKSFFDETGYFRSGEIYWDERPVLWSFPIKNVF